MGTVILGIVIIVPVVIALVYAYFGVDWKSLSQPEATPFGESPQAWEEKPESAQDERKAA